MIRARGFAGKAASAGYLLAALCAAPACAQAAPPAVPGFWQLEMAYGRTGGMAGVAERVAQALPVGVDLGRARDAIVAVGGTCKPSREPGATKCLIHQYSLADGAADDIRWTILLHAPAGTIGGVTVDRYVDRHGSD